MSSAVIVIPSPACLSSRYTGFKALLAMKQLHVILLSWRHIFRLAKFHRLGKASRFIPPRTQSAIGTAFPRSTINTSSIIVTNSLLLIGFFGFHKANAKKKKLYFKHLQNISFLSFLPVIFGSFGLSREGQS